MAGVVAEVKPDCCKRLFDATALWGSRGNGQAGLLPCPRGVTSRRVTLPRAVTYDPSDSLSPLCRLKEELE